jgi:hypothetical protein
MRLRTIGMLLAYAALSACATQVPAVKDPSAPGFLAGLWHGWIVVFSFIGSLFAPDIAIYAVPNNGAWYNFGFAIGVGALFGGGAAARR